MNAALTDRTAELLRSKAHLVSSLNVMVGLDAFVDEIVRAVDKRTSAASYDAIQTLSDLGARISNAAGQSTNLELVVERVKLGGNGPIMANALAALGTAVTCVGPLGEGELHPAFAEIGTRAKIISLGSPAHTDALEFDDGKLMMGKLEPLNDVTWERMLARIGREALESLLCGSRLVSLVNWTMIPAMSQIFEEILRVVSAAGEGPGTYFFDLADPEKHSPRAIADVCRIIARFQPYRRTVLGLNEKEAFLVGRSLGYTGEEGSRTAVRQVAAHVSGTLPVASVVVHPRAYAVVASGGEITANVDGPFTENPLISTGAGDHFNAGFCMAKMLDLSDEEAAAAAVGTSGYYVRTATSPSILELSRFLLEVNGS